MAEQALAGEIMTAMRSNAPSEDLGTLPTWNLADLYPGPDSPELEADLQRAESLADTFQRRYETRVAALSGPELGTAIGEYETVQELLGRIASYASLVYAGDMSDPKIGQFYQTVQERLNAIGTRVLFFTLEINCISDDTKFAAAELAR